MAEHGTMWDLQALARAHRLVDWTASLVGSHASGRVAEVGAGIGTYSERLLAGGADELLLIEPAPDCAAALRSRFHTDPRVTIAEEELPGVPSLREQEGSFDAVVCQNVIEHVEDDRGAVAAMAVALRPGGVLSVQVPAIPRLYNNLDVVYGHHRRYTPEGLADVLASAQLEVMEVRPFNLLGVLGWAAQRHSREPRVGPSSLRVYEVLVRLWRPIEERLRPHRGLSLIAHARRL